MSAYADEILEITDEWLRARYLMGLTGDENDGCGVPFMDRVDLAALNHFVIGAKLAREYANLSLMAH